VQEIARIAENCKKNREKRSFIESAWSPKVIIDRPLPLLGMTESCGQLVSENQVNSFQHLAIGDFTGSTT
jgi:hypothetical protein